MVTIGTCRNQSILSHHALFSLYHWIVREIPSSKLTEASQSNNSLAFLVDEDLDCLLVQSIDLRFLQPFDLSDKVQQRIIYVPDNSTMKPVFFATALWLIFYCLFWNKPMIVGSVWVGRTDIQVGRLAIQVGGTNVQVLGEISRLVGGMSRLGVTSVRVCRTSLQEG